MNNNFRKYTDNLAVTLENKNKAYGDSICNLIKRGELKENDESLEDTLLDMAGYAILGLKYLEEHKDGH